MDKRKLEIFIGSLEKLEKRKVILEQYETPPDIIADIVFIAADDIRYKKVADLGCGNGGFALAAYLMGAMEVHCVEIDDKAVEVARRNCAGTTVIIHNIDVEKFNIRVDTVLMNPPFGYQFPGADRKFIEKAIDISDTIYTIHHIDALPYIKRIIGNKGVIEFEKDYKLIIPYGFKFHRDEKRVVDVKMLKIRVNRYG